MKRAYNQLGLFLFIADVLLTILGLYTAHQLRLIIPLGNPLQPRGVRLPFYSYLAAVLFWAGSLLYAKAYHPQKVLRFVDEVSRVLVASLQATLLLAGFFYFVYRDVSRLQFIYFSGATTILILTYRTLIRFYYRIRSKSRTPVGDRRRVLVVGAGELGLKVGKLVLQRSRWGLELVGFLDDAPEKLGWAPEDAEGRSVLGKVDHLAAVVKEEGVDEVYIALPARAYDRIRETVLKLRDNNVKIKIIPDYFSLALIHAHPSVLDGLPVVSLREPVIEGTPRLVKRIFDIVVSVLLLLVLWPLFIFIAVWIWLDSPAPVIFKQKRVGEDEEIFLMYKFRTMIPDAEERLGEVIEYDEKGNIIHKKPDDPRVTPVGRFLRRTSLDELPQLFNVLKGDMSLVGPRPEMPWLVEKYEPWQRKRFTVPQGITGWWQVNKRSEDIMHLSTEDDLYYVYNYSLWLDFKILLMTVPAVLSRKGAF